MLLTVLLLILGLALMIGGGELLVRGACALARQLGVPALVVGLTVVAFGTSTPELAVNLVAALESNTDISFGNIVGSNIANVGLILGCAALLRPLSVHGSLISREIPMMLLATAAVIVMGFDRIRGAEAVFDPSDGVLLLLLFCVFLYYTIAEIVRRRITDPLVEQAEQALPRVRLRSAVFAPLLVLGGLAGLIGGAQLTVDATVALAQELGVPNVVIGLTVVAVGTSLPELVTSLLAAWHGEFDLAVGNVVGSNIFNLLSILGLTALIRPVPVPPGGHVDLLVLAVFSGVLLRFAITQKHRIVRAEGALLLAGYFGYVVLRAWIV